MNRHDDNYCKVHEKWKPCQTCATDNDRSARLARIDETARARFLELRKQFGIEASIEMAYSDALSLERARDEAVKEIQ